MQGPLFAKWQQFAGRLYGPLLAAGIAWWHGSEGNYWGHNAIIRPVPLRSTPGFPNWEGRKPFGGHILSHDFIEAALMRRGGWAIHMAPNSAEATRNPRLPFRILPRATGAGARAIYSIWRCFRHAAFHWVSRLHLLTGIGSYLTAPLWLIFLMSGILVSLAGAIRPARIFPEGILAVSAMPAQDPFWRPGCSPARWAC
jgi:membrane glycosyltransferase